ncbi:unnamed protein product [Effrenium voratum]|nr:unnamed protein product [Effrenium voratum]
MRLWMGPNFVGTSSLPETRESSVAMRSRRMNKQHVKAFRMPSPRLGMNEAERDDEEFVMDNIAHDPRSFAHASERLRKDKVFIEKVLRLSPRVVDYMHPDVWADFKFIENIQTMSKELGYGGWIYWHDNPYPQFWGRGRREKGAKMRTR